MVVLLRRIGPYHRARLSAAARFGKFWCIEGSGQDRTYAWDTVGTSGFDRLTLFAHNDSSEMLSREVEKNLAIALDSIRPEVLAIPGWEDKLAVAALSWAIKHRPRLVMMSDSHELAGVRTGFKEAIKRRFVRLCGSGLVAGTAAANYLARLGMLRERVFEGYDVVDNDYFSTMTANLRSKPCSINLTRRFFLCPARFIREKNLAKLLHAYSIYLGKQLEAKTEPWALMLLGDGPLRNEIEGQINDLNLNGWVHLPGFKQYSELPTFYAYASAVVLPSISETWGLTVNEAMASGLPVIVSRYCGCAPDLVQDGVNGFTFDPNDVQQLSTQMIDVSSSIFKWSHLGANGLKIIRRWSPALFAQSFWKAIAAALASPAMTPRLIDKLLVRSLIAGR